MMIPIVISVLDQLHESENKKIGFDKLEIEEGLDVGLQTKLGYHIIDDSARTVAINPKSFDSEQETSDYFGGSINLEASTLVSDSNGEDLLII